MFSAESAVYLVWAASVKVPPYICLLYTSDQLNNSEQDAQQQYNNKLSDYYTQLQQKGEAYNNDVCGEWFQNFSWQ